MTPTTVDAKIVDAITEFAKDMTTSLEIVENEGEGYEPRIDNEYLAVKLFINDTVTRYVGAGRKQYQGILQVTVVYPIKAGILSATEIAGQVAGYFKKGTIIDGDGVRIKINRQPSLATPIPDGAWLRVPVSIPYNCMA